MNFTDIKEIEATVTIMWHELGVQNLTDIKEIEATIVWHEWSKV